MPRGNAGLEDVDVAAATFVVGKDLIECDYLTIADAYLNLPPSGGEIYVLPGTYDLPSTVAVGGPGGKPVVVRGSGSGSTVINIGSNAIAAFTVLDLPTVRLVFQFIGLEIRGDGLTAGQSAIAYQDSTSFSEVYGDDLLVEATLETFYDIQSFDTTFTRPFFSSFSTSRIIPPSAIPGNLFKCFQVAGALTGAHLVELIKVNTGGIFGAFGWSMDADITLFCDTTFLNLTLPSAVTGFSGTETFVLFINGSADFEVYVGDNFGPGTGCAGVNFVGFAADARVVLKYGAQFFDGCLFSGIKVRCDTQSAVDVPFMFTGCNFATGGAETIALEFDTIVGSVVSGCLFNGYTTAAVHIKDSTGLVVEACTFAQTGGANTVLEDGTSDFNWISGQGLSTGAGVSVVGPSTRVEGTLRADATGTTTAAYVTLFTHTNPKGLLGIGTLKNTDGANTLTVKETATDAFGVTDTAVNDVAPGSDIMLNPEANIGTARPPYVSYAVAVIDKVAASHATFAAHHANRGVVV